MRSVTISEIKEAYIKEWENCHRYYSDMRRFKTGEAYADSEMKFINIKLEVRDEKYFLAYENSLRPHSVTWSDFNEANDFHSRVGDNVVDSRVIKKQMKEITLNPLSEKEISKYNELKSFGFGSVKGAKTYYRAGLNDENEKRWLEDSRIYSKLEERQYWGNRFNALEQKLNRGKSILCEIKLVEPIKSIIFNYNQ